jgi:hypothetical protein
MKKFDESTIEQINKIDLDKINAEDAPHIINFLMNVIEGLSSELVEVREELQRLRSELAYYKKETGFKTKSSKKDDDNNDKLDSPKNSNSSWKKGSKKENIKIDREEIIKIDKDKLPDDAEFKGYEDKIIQDILVKGDNVLYKREKYYSASENRIYMAELPLNLQNTDFGPNLKALIASLYFDCRIPENKIIRLLEDFGVTMSEGTISNILIKENTDILTEEKNNIYTAGLESTIYQQTDDTGMRVSGENHHVQIVCNELYSAYFINENKKRETVAAVLKNGKDKVSFKIILADDAGQFDGIAEERGLCWVHEFRHYKKIKTVFLRNMQLVDDFISKIKDYYKELKAYKKDPDEKTKLLLSKEFDTLFNTKTGFDILDERIELTKNKKTKLLLVLEYPELPLHNNLSESGLREFVLKRKISFGTKNAYGTKAWENYMTISATCKKIGVNFFEYIKDIFSGNMQLPKLASLIKYK